MKQWSRFPGGCTVCTPGNAQSRQSHEQPDPTMKLLLLSVVGLGSCWRLRVKGEGDTAWTFSYKQLRLSQQPGSGSRKRDYVRRAGWFACFFYLLAMQDCWRFICQQGMPIAHLKWSSYLYLGDMLKISMHVTGVVSDLLVGRGYHALLQGHRASSCNKHSLGQISSNILFTCIHLTLMFCRVWIKFTRYSFFFW